MAIDPDKRLEVCAVYESHDWSPKQVKENRFETDEEIKIKTIESWVKKYNLQKNFFASENEAIEKAIDNSLPLDEAKEIVKKKMQSSSLVTGEIINDQDEEEKDKYANLVGRELSYAILNVHTLQAEMADNLNKTKIIASKSKSMSNKVAYHSMLVNTYTTIHGKNINVVPVDPGKSTFTEENIKNMSEDELNLLIKQGS